MGTIEFFDSNCRTRFGSEASEKSPPDYDALLAEMDRVGIGEALVHTLSSARPDPRSRNPRLHISCVLTPGEPIPHLVSLGAKAVRFAPNRLHCQLTPRDCGTLLSELEAAHLPVFVDYESAHWTHPPANYDHIEQVCAAYPDLPVILCGVGIAADKHLYPLFERFSSFRIELSYYQVEGGIEAICSRFGAERLLFGTGMLDMSPASAMTYVSYARISEHQKRLIAGDNLRGLLAGGRA